MQRATAMSSGAAQVATITGPALGGLAYAVRAEPALRHHRRVLAVGRDPDRRRSASVAARTSSKGCGDAGDLFAGVRFIRNNPAILGTISLDLFAVLLGGATALLPIYARDILQTGPLGLGILRAAPAVGALLMTIVLARHSINSRVGLRMFQAVIVFGVATVVFALSQWMWLSVLALAVLGAADIVSVVIRFSLVQLATPDEMRGRVGAVNFLFINASNQLGQFESGVTAALFGVDAGRRARRRRHHRDRAVVDEAVSDAAQGGAAGVGAGTRRPDASRSRPCERRDPYAVLSR